jgi:ATP-dependent RNA helicase DeaD
MPKGVVEEEISEVGFAALQLCPRIVETLSSLGYEEPTPIQREAIPPLAAGHDLIGQAATGTGKTAAFALPLLHRLSLADKDRAKPSALILVPTRELAMQVAEAMHRYARGLHLSVFPIYGGQAFGQQFRALERGIDVVVATPGRALDHISGISTVVLDEADEMLDMGFADDLEAILKETPETRQTVLFSATLPPRIASIAKRHLNDPVQIKIAQEKVKAGSMPKVRQTAYVVQRPYKLAALSRVLDVENPASTLVFCRTRGEVDELTESLTGRGHHAEALHGGMSQQQRERVIKKLRNQSIDLVIATDVAARGLDIEQLSHVINFNVPFATEAYVHRIGRVGRAGREGVAITLAEPREHYMLRNIERATKQKIEIAQIPSVADLRTRQLEQTRTAVRDAIQAGNLEHFRVVVESLASEFDIMQIAEAAVKLVHQANTNGSDEPEEEIPTVRIREREERSEPRFGPRKGPGGPRNFGRRGEGGRRDGGRDEAGRREAGRGGRAPHGVTRLYIGLGRAAGIRPQDLVGAIANEAGIAGRDVGGIDIAERFSIVEVPSGAAEQVITALRSTKIKGRKFVVRHDYRS